MGLGLFRLDQREKFTAQVGIFQEHAAHPRLGVLRVDLAVVVLPFVDQGHDRLVGVQVELGRVGVRDAGERAGSVWKNSWTIAK